MRYQAIALFAVVGLSICNAPACATDLTKIDRTIGKEPAYKTKPKYCLLVFGPDAGHRVWLVQDGDTLYVDRNGDGDVTQPGEKIAAEKNEKGSADGEHLFKLGELRTGRQTHKNLYISVGKLDRLADRDSQVKAFVAKNPLANSYLVMVEVEMPTFKGTGVGGRVQQSGFLLDANGILQFADRPQGAPILHFGGPLEITLFGRQELKIGRETDVVLGVGSPGVGPGSHTWIAYDGVIPEKKHPNLEIAYPPKNPGTPQFREKLELKLRC